MAQRVHRRPNEHRAGPHAAPLRLDRCPSTTSQALHETKQSSHLDPRRRFLDCTKSHDSIAVEYERGGERDSTVLARIEQSIRRDDLAAGVAQNRKPDSHLAAKRLRARRVVDGNPDERGARSAKLFVVRRIFRQLAEAKGSPMPAVEKHHTHAARAQLRETARRAGRVGQLELGRDVSDRRGLAVVHAHEDSGARDLAIGARNWFAQPLAGCANRSSRERGEGMKR